MEEKKSQRGNVLVYILIAVALFAALSFAVTKDRGSSLNVTTEEQARLDASEIIQYGDGLRTIIDRMILMDNVSDTNTASNGVLFAASGANAAYGVVGAQATTEVFNPSGGKAFYQTPPQTACVSACAYEFSGQYTITGVGDDSYSELVMLVVDIKEDVCRKLNSVAGNGMSTIVEEDDLTLTRFSGSNYGDLGGANPITITGAGNEFVGKRSFCYKESGGAARYIYVHVIRSR